MIEHFELHPQLDADTVMVLDASLCRVLLMNDARYPWLILVPRRAGIREVFDLNDTDAAQLARETRFAAQVLYGLFRPHKINLAALGNVVPQLHVHVIARDTHDPAWPQPVWGRGTRIAYSASDCAARAQEIAVQWSSLSSH